jgi:hypothetical protein
MRAPFPKKCYQREKKQHNEEQLEHTGCPESPDSDLMHLRRMTVPDEPACEKTEWDRAPAGKKQTDASPHQQREGVSSLPQVQPNRDNSHRENSDDGQQRNNSRQVPHLTRKR